MGKKRILKALTSTALACVLTASSLVGVFAAQGKAATVKFVNHLKNGSVSIVKKTSDGKLLDGVKLRLRVCPKFCVNSKSQCKIEQKLLFWGVSPLSTL